MATKKPNILVIMTDEQPIRLLGCYNGETQTPAIDRLAKEGVLCQNAYTTSPVCTPARAGLFTGIYPHNTGCWANHLALNQDIRTIGHHFKKAGYRTAFIGKWHLDGLDYFGTGVCPEEFEADYWYDGRRHLAYLGEEKGQLWRSHTLDTAARLKEHNIDRDFTWGGQITNRAEQFLKEVAGGDQPWMLVVSYDEPHGPWTCPPEFLEKWESKDITIPESFEAETFEGKPSHHKDWSEVANLNPVGLSRLHRLIFACNEFVDSEIGRVLRAAEPYAESTYTTYTSDHGNFLGAHKLIFKGPSMYEETTRIPLIFKGPGLAKGAVVDKAVSHIDVLPSLLDLAGLEKPPMLDGAPLTAALKGKLEDVPDEVFMAFNRFQLDHDGYGGLQLIRSVVQGRYKMVVNLMSRDELYDLEKDPQELTNLIDAPALADTRQALFNKIIDFMYIRRDAFRGYVWEDRHWNPEKRLSFKNFKSRDTPANGFAPDTLDYDTGQPVTPYDFRLM